jgi:sialic acid synthase SpsE
MNTPFAIAGRAIGSPQPLYVVADAGYEHQGDVQLGYKLIETAGAAGADAVLFSRRRADRDPLSARDFKSLLGHAQSVRMTALAAAFDEEALELLATLDVAAIEIPLDASPRPRVLEKAARLGRPLLLVVNAASAPALSSELALCRSAGAGPIAILYDLAGAGLDDATPATLALAGAAEGAPVGVIAPGALGDRGRWPATVSIVQTSHSLNAPRKTTGEGRCRY